MNTLQGIEIKKAVELAKPFVGSLKKLKNVSRAVLKSALITEKYVIATDAHRLIRITHNNRVEESYLHHYKKEISGDYLVSNYPTIDRLIPNPWDAQKEILINVNDWLEAHELGLVAAKEHKNCTIYLQENEFNVPPCTLKAVKGKKADYSAIKNMEGYKDIPVPEFEQISFKYTLPFSTAIEKVSYNCEYMLDVMKVFKKMKIQQVKLYFYGSLRPMYFVGENIELLLLPVRS